MFDTLDSFVIGQAKADVTDLSVFRSHPSGSQANSPMSSPRHGHAAHKSPHFSRVGQQAEVAKFETKFTNRASAPVASEIWWDSHPHAVPVPLPFRARMKFGFGREAPVNPSGSMDNWSESRFNTQPEDSVSAETADPITSARRHTHKPSPSSPHTYT